MPSRTAKSRSPARLSPPFGQLQLDLLPARPRRTEPSTAPASVQEVPANSRYFTRREAAAYIRSSLRFLDSMDLPFIRKGRCRLYDRIDLDERMQHDKCRGRAWKETP